MRTIIKTITIKTFDELTKEQQAKIMPKFHDINVNYDWWDSTYYDYQQVLSILGFRCIDMNFSGFHSQGDGASFTAEFDIPTSKLEAIKRLIKLNDNFQWIYDDTTADLLEKIVDENEEDYATIYRNSTFYSHECTMQCDHEHEEILDLARHLASKLYQALDSEYTYLTSSEAIKETIIANEIEFDADTLELI